MTNVTQQPETDWLMMVAFADIKEAGIFNNQTSLKRAMDRDDDPFPQPFRLGKHKLHWLRSEVEAWVLRQRGKQPSRRGFIRKKGVA